MKIELPAKTYDNIVALLNWSASRPDCVDDYVVERIYEQVMEMFGADVDCGESGVYSIDADGVNLIAYVYDAQLEQDVEVEVSRGKK